MLHENASASTQPLTEQPSHGSLLSPGTDELTFGRAPHCSTHPQQPMPVSHCMCTCASVQCLQEPAFQAHTCMLTCALDTHTDAGSDTQHLDTLTSHILPVHEPLTIGKHPHSIRAHSHILPAQDKNGSWEGMAGSCNPQSLLLGPLPAPWPRCWALQLAWGSRWHHKGYPEEEEEERDTPSGLGRDCRAPGGRWVTACPNRHLELKNRGRSRVGKG